jgi:phage anti-repressor protein
MSEVFVDKAQIKAKSTSFLIELMSEIKIHEELDHANIVQFRHNFEDNLNVYILLELCPNKVI